MSRFLYRCLLALYPRRFRERFRGEMLFTFEEARATQGSLPLLADAVRTLLRQWTRPPAAVVASSAAGPVFHIFEPRPLPPSAILLGSAAAVMLLGMVQFATSHWSSLSLDMGTLRGTFQPNSLGISVEQPSSGSVVLGTGPMENSWAQYGRRYLEHIPILRALDRNGDSLLTAVEIHRASDVLRELDRNGDGSVSAEEAGGRYNDLPARLQQRARRDFMTFHPVHRALDANSDFTIGVDELRGAAVLLRKLDVTGDGILHPAEYLPNGAIEAVLRKEQ